MSPPEQTEDAMRRREFVAAAAGLAAALPLPGFAQAAPSPYPSRPIKFIIGFPPGGATDVVGRIMAKKLSDALGQPIVVENKPGASSNIGAELALKAPADGYTFYVNAVTNTINASLFSKLNFDFEKDFEPVAMFATVPNLLVVHPSVPVKSVKELIDYAGNNPGKLSYASSGSGTSIHLSAELFKLMAKVDMLHIPYKGSSPAVTDLIGGQVQLMFDNMPSALPHVKGGKLRALAVTTTTRSPSAPDIPTIDESALPGFDAGSWFGLMAAKGTPRDVIARLNAESNKALGSQDVKDRFLELGAVPTPLTPEGYGDYIRAEIKKWAAVVKASGAKVE
jgi:tripartite-type tricarboxylate transporter receptor subunit TctC